MTVIGIIQASGMMSHAHPTQEMMFRMKAIRRSTRSWLVMG